MDQCHSSGKISTGEQSKLTTTHLAIMLFLLFLFATAYSQELVNKCPQTNITKTCSCQTYFDGACIVTCSLAAQGDIDRLADLPTICDGHVHFVLVHSRISGLSAKLWKTLLSSQTVDISIKRSTIEGLVPPGSEAIPKVYTPGEAVIKLEHTTVGTWDWKQLKNFYSEKELTLVIDDTPLPDISPDFSQIAEGRVHKVTIDSAELTNIPDKIFADFPDLTSLSLQNNNLTSISRSVMPKPANKLEFLHLNGNQLTSIPGDLFSEMPVLKVVYLRDNQLKTLPKELFQSISSTNLQRIDFVRNPWDCTCNLMWIVQSTKQQVKLGTCETPKSLLGKKVEQLPQLLNC